MKLEFSRQIFQNYSNFKFNEKLSSGSRVVPCGRAGGQAGRRDKAKSLLKFCEPAQYDDSQKCMLACKLWRPSGWMLRDSLWNEPVFMSSSTQTLIPLTVWRRTWEVVWAMT